VCVCVFTFLSPSFLSCFWISSVFICAFLYWPYINPTSIVLPHWLLPYVDCAYISACAVNLYGKNCAEQCTCSSNAESCNSVNGTCTCKAGWEGTLCENDVNECLTNQHSCSGDHVICINEDGGYSCGCELGYKYNGSNVCLGQCRFFYEKFTMVV